jgi:AcrR family transcriptional regulator
VVIKINTILTKKIRTFSDDDTLVNERRYHIIKNATKVFIKNGYQETSVRDILNACKMSYGSLYHYIGSKYDILCLIFQYVISLHKEAITVRRESIANLAPLDALKKSITTTLQFYDEHQDLYLFIDREITSLSPRDQELILGLYIEHLEFNEEILNRGIDSGEFDLKETKLLSNIIEALCMEWVSRRWFLRKRFTLEEYTTEILSNVMAMLYNKRIS